MSDREEQLKRDIRDLQTRLADAVRPRDRIVKVPVDVVRYVDKVVDRISPKPAQIVYRPCKIQAARIAELEAIISIMELECQAL